MKLWAMLWIAVLAPVCAAQRLTVPEFARIAQVCVPEANLPDLVAIARTESGFNPWALSVNRPAALAHRFGYRLGRIYLRHQPRTKQEAVRWAQELENPESQSAWGCFRLMRSTPAIQQQSCSIHARTSTRDGAFSPTRIAERCAYSDRAKGRSS